jgi:hypothetical protein
MKEWHSEWLYVKNMLHALTVHSNSSPVVNDHWEKNPLMSEELKKIQPLLERIQILKQQGLIGFEIIASYLRHRVQPLKARENYGFEYSRAKDPSRMAPTLELTKEEVLERLKKILKGVSVVLHTVPEYRANNPPLLVSCFTSVGTFLHIFFIVGTFCLHFTYLPCCCWLFAGLGSEFHRSDPF